VIFEVQAEFFCEVENEFYVDLKFIWREG